jgi:hypothetical protein
MYMGLVMRGRQEIHTAQPLVFEGSAFEVDTATEKLKIHKFPGIHQIQAELVRAGRKQFPARFINSLILFVIRRNCSRSGRNRS